MNRYAYEGGYDEYIDKQKRTTERKRNRQWATEGDMAFIAKMLIKRGWPHLTGLCHGTRSGMEQKWLMKHLIKEGATPGMVIGSELAVSEHPKRFNPLTFEQDFNRERADWVGRFSFVYSNSFDHVYNPATTIRVWAKQLHKDGVLIIEHTDAHVKATATDPTGGTPKDFYALFKSVGLEHVDTLQYQAPDNSRIKRYFVVRNIPGS